MRDAVELTQSAPLCIKAIGVGGAGSNAVDRMIQAGLTGVEFIATNTDAQALAQSEAPCRLQLGPRTTKGLGVGGDPEWGRRAAEESQQAIREVLRGADVVFIAAGMGGGTGTGAAPVVARIAREQDALTIAAITRPFSFEGTRRWNTAEGGITALSALVHSLIVVSNDRLLPVVGRTMTFDVALRVADDVLRQGIHGISELITRPGLVNLDFASIRTALERTGGALMAIGRGHGEHRALEAAQSALHSPLLDSQLINNAETILVNITGGSDLTLHEVSEATQLIAEAAHPEADILFGAIIDPEMDGEARVTLVAGGIDTWRDDMRSAHDVSRPPVRQPDLAASADASPLNIQLERSMSGVDAGDDHVQDAYLVEPVPVYWSVPLPDQQPTAQGLTLGLGVTPAEREHAQPVHTTSPQPNESTQKSHPVPSVHSGSPAPTSARQSSTPHDVKVSQDAAPMAGPESDEQVPLVESGKGDDGERMILRFLPNLDLPAFLRR
jgi:cell division protein FtsZ